MFNFKNLLKEALELEKTQEDFLGVSHTALPTPDVLLQDINHVRNYSISSDYRIWAQEVWSKVIKCIDKLTDPKETQTDFYRGELKALLETLRIAHLARLSQNKVKEQIEARSRQPQRR